MAGINYDEKIYKLFEEGKKLGAPGLMPISIANATTDISKENFVNSTVSMMDLRTELHQQNKQTDRIQNEIQATRDRIAKTGQILEKRRTSPAFNGHTSSLNKWDSSNQGLPFSNNINTNSNNNYMAAQMPAVERFHMLPNTGNEISTLTDTKIHLENALEDSQAQVEYLTRKVEDMKLSVEQQKEHFRKAIEDLQKKLQDTVAGRKKLLDLRQQDMDQQEEMIHNLQATLKELAASNEMQEQALLDAHERMEILENRNHSNETAMSHIRSLLGSAYQNDGARRKISRFGSSEHLVDLLPELVVDNFERFMNSSCEKADSLRKQILQLEADLNSVKQSHAAERLVADSDATDAIHEIKTEQEKLLIEEKKQRMKAEDLLSAMTTEMKQLQFDHNSQTCLVDEFRRKVDVLSKQLNEASQERCNEKGDLQSKLLSVEYDLKLSDDLNERLKSDNETQKQSLAELQTRLQEIVEDLHSEREQRKTLWLKDTDSSREINDLRLQVEDKTLEISRLREVVAQLRGDITTRVAKEINEAENVQRQKAEEKIEGLSRENVGLREDLSRIRASNEAMERQVSDATVERTTTLDMLKDKDHQVERLTAQLSMADRKLIEVSEAKKSLDEKIKTLQGDYGEVTKAAQNTQSDLVRVRSVAGDKERIAMQLRHQLDTKTEQWKVSREQAEKATTENKRMDTELKEKTTEVEKLRDLLKANGESLVKYEARIAGLSEEKSGIVKNVQTIEVQVKEMISANDQITKQLKEAQYQIKRLIEERDSLTKELKKTNAQYINDTETLKKELRRKKKDLRQIQDTLHTVKNIDSKTAKVATDMQREVTDKRGIIDSLQTELSDVYDKLEKEQRGVKQYKKESSRLQKQLDSITANLKKAEEDLRHKTKTEKGYRLGVERLQMALEKAAVRNAEAQLMIDRQESEMSKAHIQRNLDMMDKRIPSTKVAQVDRPNMFAQPVGTSNNQVLLQNMLARILTSTTPQNVSRDVTSAADPQTSAVNPGRVDQNPSKDTPLLTNEIYKVLAEVREQLATRDQKSKPAPKKMKHKSTSSHRKKKLSLSSDESSMTPVVMAHSNSTLVSSESSITSTDTTAISHEASTLHEQPITGTSSLHKSDATNVDRGKGLSSPVSSLLAGVDLFSFQAKDEKNQSDTSPLRVLQESNILSSDPDVRDIVKKEQASERYVTAAISDNAEELCRQLQNRLEGLSKMGGKLERQNKDTAKLIKKQDKKLQQVRKLR